MFLTALFLYRKGRKEGAEFAEGFDSSFFLIPTFFIRLISVISVPFNKTVFNLVLLPNI
jgi:hypothetical protein